MKKLGFGLMRLPQVDDDYGKIDMKQLKEMVDHFIEHGFTYFDTSYVYHMGRSETAIREALVDRYSRDAYTLTDKMPTWLVDSLEDIDRLIDEQLQKTGAGYFDYYLMHAMNAQHYERMKKIGAFEKFEQLKTEGRIRHICISFHDTADVLETILCEQPGIEYVQVILNYADMENEGIDIKSCYETIVRHGRKVIVMEPVKGGVLAKMDERYETRLKQLDPHMSAASWAIRYAASKPGVFVVLSGMSSIGQMKDNVSYMGGFVPLNDDETAVLEKIAEDMYENRPIRLESDNKAIRHYIGLYNNRVGMHTKDGWQDIIYGSVKERYGDPVELMKGALPEEKEALQKVIEAFA
ncbi:MAG: aldo/keto reductase [Erysipelotrichaceae bacterium]|nr:aldo/keto reductase [Erysipelotrichaceae bacterium]